MRSTDFRSIVAPILNQAFDGVYDQRADEYKQIFSESTGIARSYHEEPLLYGMGSAPTMADGNPVTYDETAVQAYIDAHAYIAKRQAEYPPMTDYLDGIAKGDQAQINKYIADCQAVKSRYPK